MRVRSFPNLRQISSVNFVVSFFNSASPGETEDPPAPHATCPPDRILYMV